MTERDGTPEPADVHFVRRAPDYDASAGWVGDTVLLERIVACAAPSPADFLLDLAIGTGKVAAAFQGRVGAVFGVDICPDMVARAPSCVKEIRIGRGEALPFDSASFELCVCRQGLQFMDLDAALGEVLRVLKPGGRAVFCHLTAYGDADRERTFRIQALRNPARRNFFMPGELAARMQASGYSDTQSFAYLCRESVNRWIGHDAIGEDARADILRLYYEAPASFTQQHSLSFGNDDIIDAMRMELVRGTKPAAARD